MYALYAGDGGVDNEQIITLPWRKRFVVRVFYLRGIGVGPIGLVQADLYPGILPDSAGSLMTVTCSVLTSSGTVA